MGKLAEMQRKLLEVFGRVILIINIFNIFFCRIANDGC